MVRETGSSRGGIKRVCMKAMDGKRMRWIGEVLAVIS
jgi:hypothetical protein